MDYFRLKDKSGLYWTGADVSTKPRKALHFKSLKDAERERSCVSGLWFPLCQWRIVRVTTGAS